MVRLDYQRERVFYLIKDSGSFDCKTKLVGILGDNLPTIPITARAENIKIVVPLKNLSNFMFNLDFLTINSEIELILKWSEDCVLTEKVTRRGLAAGDDDNTEPLVPAFNVPSDLKFSITDCKMYVPVVTLQTQYQNQLYKELKTGISIDFKWSKYRSQTIKQQPII